MAQNCRLCDRIFRRCFQPWLSACLRSGCHHRFQWVCKIFECPDDFESGKNCAYYQRHYSGHGLKNLWWQLLHSNFFMHHSPYFEDWQSRRHHRCLPRLCPYRWKHPWGRCADCSSCVWPCHPHRSARCQSSQSQHWKTCQPRQSGLPSTPVSDTFRIRVTSKLGLSPG